MALFLQYEAQVAAQAQPAPAMLTVCIPCHPLTRRVLLAHYGGEPVIAPNHDILFDILSTAPLRKSVHRNRAAMTSTISFSLADPIAIIVQRNAHTIAERLFRQHKNMMCWYAAAQVRAKGKGYARPAIADWLSLHDVDENEYGVDTAYKCFQRFGWIFDEKNARFSGQVRQKAAAKLSAKRSTRAKTVLPLEPLKMRLSDIEVELVVSRFLTQYNQTFSRMPYKLAQHARVCAYIKIQGLSIRSAAEKLSIGKPGAEHAVRSMRQRMERNPTVKRLWEQSFALPAAT